MADHADRHQAERIEAGCLRMEHAEIRRVTMDLRPEDLETRSGYTPSVNIPTVSAEMIDRWPGTQGDGGGQQAGSTSVNPPSGNPAGQQSKDQ